MLEPYADMLHRCAVCHDQCIFTNPEVFASGRQTYATSRKAMFLQAVRRGQMDWSPELVDLIYAASNSGVQHALCVNYGEAGGWPDETLYVRAARAEIVRAGQAPVWALQMRQEWSSSGNPYGLSDPDDEDIQPGAALFLADAATRAFSPAAAEAWLSVAETLHVPAGAVRQGSSGFELYDLGFLDEARRAALHLVEILNTQAAGSIVSDSPEAVWMMSQVWPGWGAGLNAPVLHTTQWLARVLQEQNIYLEPDAGDWAFLDPACLARYLAEVDAPREALQRLGVNLVEMLRHGEQALPSGSYTSNWPSAWTRKVAEQRCAEARAVDADGILTASPFDSRNLRTYGNFPVKDLAELALERIQ